MSMHVCLMWWLGGLPYSSNFSTGTVIFAKLKLEDKDSFLSGSRIKSCEENKFALFLIYTQSTAECIDFKKMV